MFVLRPKLPDYWRDRIERDTDQKGLGRAPSRSWWARGALVVDEAGPALLDADGQRVPLPVPPAGGRLVHLEVRGKPPPPQRPTLRAAMRSARTSGRAEGGQPGRPAQHPVLVIYLNFICDPTGQVTARLPGDDEGFGADGLAEFAAAAGLVFQRSTSVKDFPGLRTSLDLRVCVDNAAYRASWPARVKRMLHIQGRRSPYEEPHRSRYPVTTPPYQLPGE